MIARWIIFSILIVVMTSHASDDPVVPLSETDWPLFMKQKVSDPKTVWETHRRAEIVSLFENHIYGKAPDDGFQLAIVDCAKLNGAAPLSRLSSHSVQADGSRHCHGAEAPGA